MTRAPNFGMSQWFRDHGILTDAWVDDAHCGKYPQLPWTSDTRPDPDTLLEMHTVCTGCPVRRKCAGHALTANNGYGAEGGFYAGVWLPWMSRNETADTKHLRRSARSTLRSFIRKTVDTEHCAVSSASIP